MRTIDVRSHASKPKATTKPSATTGKVSRMWKVALACIAGVTGVGVLSSCSSSADVVKGASLTSAQYDDLPEALRSADLVIKGKVASSPSTAPIDGTVLAKVTSSVEVEEVIAVRPDRETQIGPGPTISAHSYLLQSADQADVANYSELLDSHPSVETAPSKGESVYLLLVAPDETQDGYDVVGWGLAVDGGATVEIGGLPGNVNGTKMAENEFVAAVRKSLREPSPIQPEASDDEIVPSVPDGGRPPASSPEGP